MFLPSRHPGEVYADHAPITFREQEQDAVGGALPGQGHAGGRGPPVSPSVYETAVSRRFRGGPWFVRVVFRLCFK